MDERTSLYAEVIEPELTNPQWDAAGDASAESQRERLADALLPRLRAVAEALELERAPSAATRLPQLGRSMAAFIMTARRGDLVRGYQATGALEGAATALYGSAFHMALGRERQPIRRFLITGETGTGKEGLARIIGEALVELQSQTLEDKHRGSFGAVNCAAFTESLLEAELFGWEKGSHQGARQARKGVVASLASGGVLFLDEVGEAGAKMQAALLRFVQDGSYRSVGADRETAANLHVIAATNRSPASTDPEWDPASGLRPDLAFRLAQPRMTLRPLRSLTDNSKTFRELVESRALHQARDLPAALQVRLQTGEIARTIARVMGGHPWPGNFRELDGLINEVLFAGVAPDGWLDPARVEMACARHCARGNAEVEGLPAVERQMADGARRGEWPIDLRAHRLDHERSWYQRAADEFENIEGVATALGVARQTASRRLKVFGLSPRGLK